MNEAVAGFFAGLFWRPHRWDRSRKWFAWFLIGRDFTSFLLLFVLPIAVIYTTGFFIGRMLGRM